MKESERLELSCNQEWFLKRLSEEAPPYSECVKVGKRSLSWARWVDGFSKGEKNGFLDRHNLEFSHEHLFFEQSGESLGFSPQGIFSEDPSKYQYRMDGTCYDGSKIRSALGKLGEISGYNFITNNCQDFIQKVLQLYNREK